MLPAYRLLHWVTEYTAQCIYMFFISIMHVSYPSVALTFRSTWGLKTELLKRSDWATRSARTCTIWTAMVWLACGANRITDIQITPSNHMEITQSDLRVQCWYISEWRAETYWTVKQMSNHRPRHEWKSRSFEDITNHFQTLIPAQTFFWK